MSMTEADRMALADDLAYLEAHGALAGIAEIARERRRQVETLGYTTGHDDRHVRGELAGRAYDTLYCLFSDRTEGTADPATDEDGLRKAGALCAAEIDRLNRMTDAPEPEREEDRLLWEAFELIANASPFEPKTAKAWDQRRQAWVTGWHAWREGRKPGPARYWDAIPVPDPARDKTGRLER